MQGIALTLLVLLFFAALFLIAYLQFEVPPLAQIIAWIIAGCVVGGMLIYFVGRPAMLKLTDEQIALYVEEQMPEMEDRLNSAVEVSETGILRRKHSALIDKLIDDAAKKAKTIPLTTVVDRKRERILAYSSAAALFVFSFFVVSSLDDIRSGLQAVNLTIPTTEEQPAITILPGNVEIEKGESQEIIVELRDESDRDVILHFKEGEGQWEKVTMQRGLDRTKFLHELLFIQEPVSYFITYEEQQSEPFAISLYEFPAVSQIDLTYRYPEYTQRANRFEEDTGDIRGLQGSQVTLDVHTTGAPIEGSVVLESGRTIPLRQAGEGRFRARLTLAELDGYQVRLLDAENKQNKFPEDFQIVPIEDERPYINISDPQRDVRANAIEEVLIAVEVEDDYGLQDVQLVFSVNGEDDETLTLANASNQTTTELTGEHLFFLEDYTLEPGDVISYYVSAKDHFYTEEPEESDMYFIEVIPFDQQFTQVNNQGQQGGGGQQSQIVLTQQEIIAATWKLRREQKDMDEAEYREALSGLVQAQANLKANIEERINSTAFSLELRMDESNRKVVEHLREAIAEMSNAVIELQAEALREAIKPERKALNHLLRADAQNKEQQIARQQQQGGGGGGGGREERMTELMDLELDIAKDKYEVQNQRSQQQQQNAELDEALRKVQELARKQENLANQSQQQFKGEDQKRYVDRLKREQDQLREQTEQLADNLRQQARQNGQLSREMEQQLSRVAENMQQAEQALKNGKPQEALSKQQQALNELNRLQQQLQVASSDNTTEMVERLADNFEQIQQQEEQLAEDIQESLDQARQNNGAIRASEVADLQDKRENIIENLRNLEEETEAVRQRALADDAELAQEIKDLQQELRRQNVERMMQNAERALEQGWLDYANRVGEEIQEGLGKVDNEMRSLRSMLPQSEGEQVTQALDEVRDMLESFEELQAQAQALQQGQQGQAQQGQPQQGQPQQGQQQGQQQEGQQAGGGQPNGGQTPNINPGRQQQALAARMQRQLEEAQDRMRRLQDEFGNQPQFQQMFSDMYRALNRADNTGVLLGENAADYFNNRVYQPLSQLELELARKADALEMNNKLYGARKGEVPAEYRNMVDKYYEALAKSGGTQ